MNTIANGQLVTAKEGTSLRRRFYIGISLLMGIMAIVGFWVVYFGPLVHGVVDKPLLIHIHAAVFVGWLALFLAQVVLAATEHVAWHLKLGRFGIGYGVLLVLVGLYTGIVRSAERMAGGTVGARLFYSAFSDMVFFSIFFAAAIICRRKPEIHKRLMIVAATGLLIAATARMSFLPDGPWRNPVQMAIWASPVLIAMAYDFRCQRRIHPVYLVGFCALLVRKYSVFLGQTDGWSAFTNWMIHLVY